MHVLRPYYMPEHDSRLVFRGARTRCLAKECIRSEFLDLKGDLSTDVALVEDFVT